MAMRYGYESDEVEPKPTTDPLIAWAYRTFHEAHFIIRTDPLRTAIDDEGRKVLAAQAVNKLLQNIGIVSQWEPVRNGFVTIPEAKRDEFRRSVFQACSALMGQELRKYDYDIVVTANEVAINLCNGELIVYNGSRWRCGQLVARDAIADILGESIEFVRLIETMAHEVRNAFESPDDFPKFLQERREWKGRGNEEHDG